MNKVMAVLSKEWADIRRNKTVFAVVTLVPVLMLLLPIAVMILSGMLPVDPRDLEEMQAMLDDPRFLGMAPQEALQSAMASTFLLLFLMMPLMVPVTIAAYSIVGEKVTRSLEPLLAAPVTTGQLMLGKGLAAALPGIVPMWIAFALFLLVARFFAASERVFRAFIDPMWLAAIFVLAPLLTILAVAVGMIVSSRTSDPRSAEQLGSLIILPLMILLLGVLTGFIPLNTTTFLVAALIILAADAILLWVSVRLFRRETILTRWK